MSQRKQRALISISSASISLVLFILYAANCGESSESSYQPIGECSPQLDDGDPCTDDTCEDGVNRHTPLPDGLLCKLGKNGGHCEQGTCKLSCLSTPSGCSCDETTADCPMPTDCMGWSCDNNNICKSEPKTDMPTPQQILGDCQVVLCTADGGMMAKNDNEDRPPSTNPCRRGTCTEGQPGEEPISEGKPCENGVSGVCNSAGECVSCFVATNVGCPQGEVCYETGTAPAVTLVCTHCADGVQNGDETDVDCGGHCSISKKCEVGHGCKLASDCGAPSSGCVAEVCCNSTLCTDLCSGCQAGSGACVALPPGASDARCLPEQVCTGVKTCAELRHAGEPCVSAGDCINVTCEGSPKTCVKSKTGDRCIDTSDCVDQMPALMCDKLTHTCK